jgi:hypothetical protein
MNHFFHCPQSSLKCKNLCQFLFEETLLHVPSDIIAESQLGFNNFLVEPTSCLTKNTEKTGQYHASQITVLLHAIGSLALTIGFIITGLRNTAI